MTPRRRKGNKYGAQKVTQDGIRFDSMLEAKRYGQLKLMEQADVITGLVVHPKYEVLPGFTYNGKRYRPITYYADFEYFDKVLDKWVIEDTKGFRTPTFQLKEKLFLSNYMQQNPHKIFRVLTRKDI